MKKAISVLWIAALLLLAACAKTVEPGVGASAAKLYLEEIPAREPDKHRVFYEIFVGSFYDSDGDGMGDLAGITEKLDYLNDGDPSSDSSLHVEGLWLMPISPSPTYHKYDVTDYYAVAPEYGTMADFEALIAACDARGVGVILDLVVNHTSNEHPWFQSALASLSVPDCGDARSCTDDVPCPLHNKFYGYYSFSDRSAVGYAPVTTPGVKAFYEARFWSGMPDLNLDNPDVRDEITSIMRFWLDKGAAGFRLDATTSYYTGNVAKNTEFLRWVTRTAHGINPDAYLVGEAWSDAGTVRAMYGSGIDSLFNFPFSQFDGAIASAVRTGKGAEFATKLESWHAELAALGTGAIDAPFLTNHDNARSAGALLRDPILEKQAAALYLLLPGNPFIYYGEEIGQTGGADRDENKRTPLIWSLTEKSGETDPPVGTTKVEPVAAGVAEQLADEYSLLRFYIGILRIRTALPALDSGEVTAFSPVPDSVAAYRCSGPSGIVLVLHNLGAESVTVDLAGQSGAVLAAYNADGTALAGLKDGALTLPPHSGAIIG